jgi:hypothetical protein
MHNIAEEIDGEQYRYRECCLTIKISERESSAAWVDEKNTQ